MFLNKKKVRRGDTIGCLVNIEQQNINFYYNGQLVLVKNINKIIKNLPIFAFTIVKYNQNFRFNFGNRALKNPPNEHYETFHSEIIKKLPSFQIKIKDNIEWLCVIKDDDDNSEDLQVFDYSQNNLETLFRFNDSIQKQLNEKIIKIETMINDNYNFEQIAIYLYSFLLNLDEDSIFLVYRLFQSIVESLWYKIDKKNKITMLSECIFFILCKKNIDKIFEKYSFKNLQRFTICLTNYHPFLANYIFIFFKTIDFQNKTHKNQTKIHNICLILSNFSNDDVFFCCEYLKKQCELFFFHVLNYSTNPWCQFYAIKNLSFIEEQLKQYLLSAIEKKEKPPFLIWRNSFNNHNALKNTRVIENSAQLQLYQYLQHYLPKTLQTTNDNASTQDFDFEVSDTKNFMCSCLNLMVRNDNYDYYVTIRYKFSIKPPSFYFEVTIITGGLMKIGLAVNKMNIEDVVGHNDLSIGIDGYEKCVWMHNYKKYKFKTSRPQWNAGDVIGIYVDFANRAVIFGINNKIIEIDGDPFEEEFIFSILPCHVAASLGEYQQCFFNFDCKTIPRAFLNKLEPINQNVNNIHNSVLTSGSTATIGNITISDMSHQFNNKQILNFDKQLNIIMKSDEATGRSLQTWSTVTGEINLAYGRVLSEGYKGDNRITLNACEQWRNQMESILRDIKNPVHFYDEYMRKIGEINRKLENDAQKPNSEPSPHNQPLMLMTAPVQLGQSNFSLWLNSLMMVLNADGAVQAVESSFPEKHPLNLIACCRILQTVSHELKALVEQLKIAYDMLLVLRHKYEKKDELSQSSTANVSRKRAFPHADESDPETSVKQRQNQPSTSWAP